MKKLSILLIICLSLSCLVFAQKPDALQLYRDGRNFDAAGQTAQARAAFQQSVDVCRQELQQNSRKCKKAISRKSNEIEYSSECKKSLG